MSDTTSTGASRSRSLIWAGSYTAEFSGAGEGLTPLARNVRGDLVRAGSPHPTPSPSFVAAHPTLPMLYTADETLETVSAFAIDPDDPAVLVARGSQSAGPAVCHVAVEPGGTFVTATCWGNGRVLLYPLDDHGLLGSPVVAVPARDPHADRRAGGTPARSRAHMTLMLDTTPEGHPTFATTDLGVDLVRLWMWVPAVPVGESAPAGSLVSLGEVVLPLGSGPRHCARLPDGRLLVVTEHSVEVAVLEPTADAGTPYRLAATVSVLSGAPATGDSAAEIALSPDGRLAYVGVRGSDLLATLEVQAHTVHVVSVVPSGGRIPRHHLVDGDRVHVAHQGSNEVTTHELGPDGIPGRISARVPLGSPSVLVPWPRR